MQIHSAPLVPEPICNHVDIVHNDHDVLNDHLDISTVQLIELPEDNLLDRMPALAAMDGIPGFQSVLAPLNAEPRVSAHTGCLASACNYSSPHAVDPTD